VKVRLVAEALPADANLVVVPAGGSACATVDYPIESNGDGTFDVRDVPRGNYEMAATSGREMISALIPVSVIRDIDDLKLAVTPPVTVRGTVIFGDLPAGIDVNVLLGEIRVNLVRARSGINQVATSTADSRNFNFSIPGLGPGFYYPGVDLPPGAYIQDIDVMGIQRGPGGGDEDWTCNAPPAGLYSYLDVHGHLEPLELPKALATNDPKTFLCLRIDIRFSGHLAGTAVSFEPGPPLVVLMPRSAWASHGDRVLRRRTGCR
jgi:hypothetical protein